METKAVVRRSSKKKKNPFFCYKNRPLVRQGDTLYYGNMSDGFTVKLRVKDIKKVKGLNVATNVAIQLLDVDPATPQNEQILRASEKEGLYQALDVACAWLEKYVSMQESGSV